jgi:outer membrane protein insertion porin family/translocation and assembly module TamA
MNLPFVYAGLLDDALQPLLISYPELFGSLDFRDDRVSPHKGFYFSADVQVAGVGGDVRDFKVQPEARAYLPLARRVTLAVRTTTGLLFPQNYEQPEPQPDRVEWVRNLQILLFRGFFSGGANSNRGYASRGIGPHGPIPFFFDPGVASDQIQMGCAPDAMQELDDRCKLPLGGLTLWEASLELRYPIMGPVTGNLFCDTSDVAPGQVEYRFDRPHLSCGPGLRYETPVGPLRADVGYRIPGMQVLSGDADDEGEQPTIFGVPIAVAIGIGEAF